MAEGKPFTLVIISDEKHIYAIASRESDEEIQKAFLEHYYKGNKPEDVLTWDQFTEQGGVYSKGSPMISWFGKMRMEEMQTDY